jgi:hypothetical protein
MSHSNVTKEMSGAGITGVDVKSDGKPYHGKINFPIIKFILMKIF